MKKTNQSPHEEKLKAEELEEKRQEARIKMFIQMLDVKKDTNMTRIYTAIKSIKTA